MPTVDQLAPAPAAADTDELLASQSGVLRRVTRAQLLAGTQSQITLPTANLLGRTSSGSGLPEPITIGGGLTLANGSLSMTPAAALNLASLDASSALVTPAGGTTPRSLADLFAAAVSPESFGAIGDGVTDDTASLAAAVATLRPILLGPRTYAVSGQWTIPVAAILLGAPGQTRLRRKAQATGGAWIAIQGPSFRAHGIIFDANSPAIPGENWAVLVAPTCLRTEFHNCVFTNAGGPSLGNGLTILASDPATTGHVIDSCEAMANAAHGIWVQAVDGARITNNRVHDNVAYGINVDYNDATFVQAVRLALISGNSCWNNARGIAVGNFNATNREPPSWGNANPDAIGAAVVDNICHDNIYYGIAVSGRSLLVQSNLLTANGNTGNGGAGILVNAAYSRVADNTITGNSQFGIDSGGSIVLDIAGNHITGAACGINPGGSQAVTVRSNVLQDNGWGMLVYNVETDGAGNNFGLACSNLAITDNTIGISSGNGGGIWLIDGPQSVLVARNNFFGTSDASIGQCLYTNTDSVLIEGNRWNNTQRLFANPTAVNGLQTILLPDIADEVMLSAVPSGVQSIKTMHQLNVAGQITFIKPTAGGSGYTHAAVAISGTGTGATAIAYIANGALIGVAIVSPGSGYGSPGSPVAVTISGDGTGAAATASVGLSVIEGRRVRLACNTAVHFARAGSNPFQENWTLGDITVPANATITFTGVFGAWRADNVPLADYIAPPGDGSLLLRTLHDADLIVRPSTTGHFRVSTDADPGGYIAAIGHGSPIGVVTAPPGSDYRNLDGGVGQTLWIKRLGADSQGWFAVA
ncbi:right-handed parallel beta-helix repeat-containing protein [Acidisphaera sp. L21]|uniref:right-handed parallel beta-helix repeat-containing protein n=1 Tax=Acidisphaera sp. L21 TaxID=1641851 RepID=UPI00131D2436|nr:right-handed parallel beta-helix repeat-containing protein [Acidisphaera sp. L21]